MNFFAAKKIIIACVLAISAASAFAEWTKVGETDTATFYIDYKAIRKDGNLRKVWEVSDFKRQDKNGALSMRTRKEYDCKMELFRNLFLSVNTEPMGNGLPLSTDESIQNWGQIAPQSSAATILQIVCAK